MGNPSSSIDGGSSSLIPCEKTRSTTPETQRSLTGSSRGSFGPSKVEGVTNSQLAASYKKKIFSSFFSLRNFFSRGSSSVSFIDSTSNDEKEENYGELLQSASQKMESCYQKTQSTNPPLSENLKSAYEKACLLLRTAIKTTDTTSQKLQEACDQADTLISLAELKEKEKPAYPSSFTELGRELRRLDQEKSTYAAKIDETENSVLKKAYQRTYNKLNVITVRWNDWSTNSTVSAEYIAHTRQEAAKLIKDAQDELKK